MFAAFWVYFAAEILPAMSKNLVIVESPAKAKTIASILGKDFKVESSYGHIGALGSKGMGVDIDVGFEPQ